MQTPRMRARVVCTLWVTIETLAPTMRLSRVDLPALGSPIRATKPARVSVIGILHPLQKRLGRGLFGLALGACAGTRGSAVGKPHLDGEDRRVIRPLAAGFDIGRRQLAAGLGPFLQAVLASRASASTAPIRAPQSRRTIARAASKPASR